MTCCPDCPVAGDELTVEYRVPGGVAAGAVVASVRKPDLGVFSPPVAHIADDLYRVTVTATQAGQWWFRFTASAPADVCEVARVVAPAMVVV